LVTVGVDDRYVVISADCHAGGSIDQYLDYLDPAYRDEFDQWRGAYSNPFRDLQGDGRTRNWDSERRFAELETDGQVAEVIFPNTVPPFFPTGMLIARPPTAEDLDRRWAGLRAHNRWLADWCAQVPERRAGVAQVFLNDVDLAVEEAKWAHEHGLRGGIMIPAIPDDSDIAPLYSPAYDPLWKVCEELGIIVNHHAGSGHPDYGKFPSSQFMWAIETEWFAHRPFWQILMSGVFERFPKTRFVLTEQGCAWLPATLAQLDGMHFAASTGRMGELKMDPEANLSMKPSEYFARNVWVGVSFPGPREAKAMKKLGLDRMMWGSDYPHHEGSSPFSRELMRRAFFDWTPDELDQIFNRTAADLYGFDVAGLAARAAEVGPTVAELTVPLEGIPRGATSPAFYR
jgi:predicted TIM-barrel fold metal-dependent hydrolase